MVKTEYLAHGANMEMIFDEPDYFTRGPRDDSVFGKDVLKLVSAEWMNPNAKIECIPSKYARLDVALYHVYHKDFSVADLLLKIWVSPMSAMLTDGGDFTELYNNAFPKQG